MKVERLSVYVHLTSHWFHIQHQTENTRVFPKQEPDWKRDRNHILLRPPARSRTEQR